MKSSTTATAVYERPESWVNEINIIENPSIAFIFEDTQSGVTSIKSRKGSGAITFGEGRNVKSISFDSSRITACQGVQLWENGPYWASCNIGASKPEIKPLVYYEPPHMIPSYGFNEKVYQHTIGGASLTSDIDLEHDVAYCMWGNGWRIPSQADCDNLIQGERTTVSFTSINNVNGLLVTGKGAYSKNSIFLPAAGSGVGTTLFNYGGKVLYWTRTYATNETAVILYADLSRTDSWLRYYGLPIRPVLEL